MFNRSSFKVKKKAKQYKQWLEKIAVSPYPFEIGGRNYYLVRYVKLRQRAGTAVFSDEEEVVQDLKKAHRSLFQFYHLSQKIKEEGQIRAQVNLDLFRVPMAKMDEHPDPKWDEGYAFIKKLLGFQLTYRKTHDDFWNHLRNRNEENLPLTEAELELAVYTAAKLETIQFHVIKELSRNFDVLERWQQGMQEAGLWDELKREQQVFYLQLLQNAEYTIEEAKKVKSDDFDRSLKLNRTAMESYMIKEQREEEDVLRFP